MFNGGAGGFVFFLIYMHEGPQAVPARPSGKGRISVDEAFGGGEGTMKNGARAEVELGRA
jgi:hypothetical protein